MNNLEYAQTLSGIRQYDFCANGFPNERNLQTCGYVFAFVDWLASEHVEPIVLTAEERKAAELAVSIGLPWISKDACNVLASDLNSGSVMYGLDDMPNVKIICNCSWITDNPIDLRELLKSQKPEPKSEDAVGGCRNCAHRHSADSEAPCRVCSKNYLSQFKAAANG